jgi:hypothetical protein
MSKVKVLQDTDRLVQVTLPMGAYAGWLTREKGFCVWKSKGKNECGVHPHGLPYETLFSRKCPPPKVYSGCSRGEIHSLKGGVKNAIIVLSETAVYPTMIPPAASNVLPLFGGMEGIRAASRDLTAARGKLTLATTMSEMIDRFFDEHKCKRVFVVYRQTPTALPCDDKTKVGMVVYAEFGIMGC